MASFTHSLDQTQREDFVPLVTKLDKPLVVNQPFWLLQLWLNATFVHDLKLDKPEETDSTLNDRPIEGIHLGHTKPNDSDLFMEDTLTKYIMMITRQRAFTPEITPFAYKRHGPEWFTREFPPSNPDLLVKSREIWESFLTPKLIVTRLGPKEGVKLLCHLPNLVARQFGLCQPVPRCFYTQKRDLCLWLILTLILEVEHKKLPGESSRGAGTFSTADEGPSHQIYFVLYLMCSLACIFLTLLLHCPSASRSSF
ncbi:unnamed protein product [Vicia faba]|uniref:Aminotransferase-like plant mobile domain-containing protein n=1 Tax=Vicia faba TaxID=3906 RepID=A0AAV1BAT6_VICFA|nr:unnamed protein product [Vicia faba]